MQIPSDYRPLDPANRRRAADPAKSRPADGRSPSADETGDTTALSVSREDVARFVEQMKGMEPDRLHRVEELRARIADGSYRAEPDELAGPLADLLGHDGHG